MLVDIVTDWRRIQLRLRFTASRASWSKDKAIFGLRNPSDKPQRYYTDLTKDFEIPAGERLAVLLLKAVVMAVIH